MMLEDFVRNMCEVRRNTDHMLHGVQFQKALLTRMVSGLVPLPKSDDLSDDYQWVPFDSMYDGVGFDVRFNLSDEEHTPIEKPGDFYKALFPQLRHGLVINENW